MNEEKRRVISILMENEAGALCRVAGLFSARGFNIESLNVAPTFDPTLSRMTLVTVCNEHIMEQINKQLNKLIDVVKLVDLSEGDFVDRELMLIKIKANPRERSAYLLMAETFRGRVVDINQSSLIIEITGSQQKLNAFVNAFDPACILELSRTGLTGLASSDKDKVLSVH